MLRSALRLGPLLDEWLTEPVAWSTLRSRLFTYAVLPDSMRSADQLFTNYDRIDQLYASLIGDETVYYLGE